MNSNKSSPLPVMFNLTPDEIIKVCDDYFRPDNFVQREIVVDSLKKNILFLSNHFKLVTVLFSKEYFCILRIGSMESGSILGKDYFILFINKTPMAGAFSPAIWSYVGAFNRKKLFVGASPKNAIDGKRIFRSFAAANGYITKFFMTIAGFCRWVKFKFPNLAKEQK